MLTPLHGSDSDLERPDSRADRSAPEQTSWPDRKTRAALTRASSTRLFCQVRR